MESLAENLPESRYNVVMMKDSLASDYEPNFHAKVQASNP
jgi:hypothetical protein